MQTSIILPFIFLASLSSAVLAETPPDLLVEPPQNFDAAVSNVVEPPAIPGVSPGSMPPPAQTLAASSAVRTTRVPAIDTMSPGDAGMSSMQTTPPPPLNLLSGTDSKLSARERTGVALSRDWIDGNRSPDAPAAGSNGAVVFRYGGPLPSVVCAPLFVCQIALQRGETVNGIDVGDPVRWNVTPAVSGEGPNQLVHVVIKAHDIGLATNLLITTDRRTYTIKLVSRRDDWMPAVSFSYPEEEAAAWAALARTRVEKAASSVMPQTGQSLADLDFGYRVAGDKPVWRPLRVYNDGRQTFIQFPAAMAADEAPALVAVGDGKEQQLVNYRAVGDRYVVDRVLNRALLMTGVGRKATTVRIDRERRR